MIAFPTDTPKARAERLGYHPFTIASLIRSDMFQEALRARRAQFEALLDQSIVNKVQRVAGKALDVLEKKLDKKGDMLPFKEVAETTTSVLSILGYGPKGNSGGPSVVVQQNTVNGNPQQVAVAVSAEDLAGARNKLRQLENLNAEIAPPPTSSLSKGASDPDSPLVIDAKPEASSE
jgi:hypothetical protein